MSRWLNHIGFSYRDSKKGFFNDKHEDKRNVKARKEFITTYLNLELHAHHWVQVPESVARNLEKEECIINAYHQFIRKGEVY